MSTQIILPRMLQVGENASHATPTVLASLGCSRPLIITDKMMVQLGYAANVQAVLAEQGMQADIFDDTVPEPTVASIQAGVTKISEGDYDSIIALGGGSPIDSAKAISILGKFGGEMRDYKFPRVVTESGLPIVAIPTTAGTGSEVTKVTIITDETTDEKMLCMGVGFMPIAALVDFSLTLSVPARTTADTGIDALTHAMEAYVSKKASLYSDTQALEAMRLIAPNLRRVYHDGADKEAREAMMLGSTLAGIAFSNASVALVHGMSRPIGAAFHVPHGLSNAMLLPAVTEYSIPAASERYADCARAMGVASQQDSDEAANAKLVAELKALNEELKVPTPEEFGIDKEHFMSLLDTMAEQALASGSPNNNPRVPSAEEVIELYKELWA
ncbi:iron-containing alcohol dehydrogenase [Marinomonas mediterranea]|jgi:Alcohol dehydrogenase, class IV|uniref:Alcohol dehydrogenase n=1 Tax=Marinomonas mediterranea (strain ATCC 700492 / JCM 21426 / NBRC 103028 / MMB-1) TaxID=717774 RepID=F2JU81_MARM1|nr:iron-containing alcohol dehydrogenase [Marinomonas mediterranea]ADZ91593.1 Alcohol dehydrogenase [Marinomonas mediterranea MMB-1]WCN09555.1 iron-containing alcohol dehydrogenase [Marinomonas mediterranea]WCN13633.1 iron-containing alcohol dehydrogenase [Marinomonas mediterranea]WCN17696.1 iron-containing alcohol dehydrogenase [Marinomonas mediterranea MMB-1]